jgi:hypothetical protein
MAFGFAFGFPNAFRGDDPGPDFNPGLLVDASSPSFFLLIDSSAHYLLISG